VGGSPANLESWGMLVICDFVTLGREPGSFVYPIASQAFGGSYQLTALHYRLYWRSWRSAHGLTDMRWTRAAVDPIKLVCAWMAGTEKMEAHPHFIEKLPSHCL
jgi:hypothetical protein